MRIFDCEILKTVEPDKSITPGFLGSGFTYYAKRPPALTVCVFLALWGITAIITTQSIASFILTAVFGLCTYLLRRRWLSAAKVAIERSVTESETAVSSVPAPVPEPRRPEQATSALPSRVPLSHADAPAHADASPQVDAPAHADTPAQADTPATIPLDPVRVGADHQPHPAAELPPRNRRRAPAPVFAPFSDVSRPVADLPPLDWSHQGPEEQHDSAGGSDPGH